MSVLHSHPFDLSTFVSTDVKDRDQYTCWNNLSQLRTLAPFLGCIYLKIEAPYLASMLQDFCAPVHEFLSRCSSSQIVLRIEQISAYLSDINTTISISDVSLFSIYIFILIWACSKLTRTDDRFTANYLPYYPSFIGLKPSWVFNSMLKFDRTIIFRRCLIFPFIYLGDWFK